ncbi:Cyclin-A3-1 [Platanthera zijinensis]|uniref:Cyclin-A3-1 n=1 Tax=Platanthera zijinensis TaxID=2320716 RepID=A0AAP0FVF1_9ASPA
MANRGGARRNFHSMGTRHHPQPQPPPMVRGRAQTSSTLGIKKLEILFKNGGLESFRLGCTAAVRRSPPPSRRPAQAPTTVRPEKDLAGGSAAGDGREPPRKNALRRQKLQLLGVSAMLIASRFMKAAHEDGESKKLRQCTGYKLSDLKECIHLIHDLQLNRRGSNLLAIREKYKQHRREGRARRPSSGRRRSFGGPFRERSSDPRRWERCGGFSTEQIFSMARKRGRKSLEPYLSVCSYPLHDVASRRAVIYYFTYCIQEPFQLYLARTFSLLFSLARLTYQFREMTGGSGEADGRGNDDWIKAPHRRDCLRRGERV